MGIERILKIVATMFVFVAAFAFVALGFVFYPVTTIYILILIALVFSIIDVYK